MRACDTGIMTMTSPTSSAPDRVATHRTVLMCRPVHFTVSYRINPWMHPEDPTDTSLAVRQWETLYAKYQELGFDIHLIDPVEGLPDMVYAANGGYVLDGKAFGAKFEYPERQPEGPAYMEWFARQRLRRAPSRSRPTRARATCSSSATRSTPAPGSAPTSPATTSCARIYGREVVTLTLVDPSFYHLDTAFAVLDSNGGPGSVAYLPKAFDAPSLAILQERFPEAIIVTDEDAAVLGLNSFSDGKNVVIASRAKDFERQLIERGFTPHGVDLSELLLGGGGVKCCTLELRR